MMFARYRALTPVGVLFDDLDLTVEMMFARYRALTRFRFRFCKLVQRLVEMMFARYRALTRPAILFEAIGQGM